MIFIASTLNIHRMKKIKHKATVIFWSVTWPLSFIILVIYALGLCVKTLAILAPVYFKYQYVLFRHNWKNLK